jgi:hypothetical protein
MRVSGTAQHDAMSRGGGTPLRYTGRRAAAGA